MNADTTKREDKYRWAGPLLFAAVLAAITIVFVWFLSA